MGRHGQAKNRFALLHSLTATTWSKDESELDDDDIWRYCRWGLGKFNSHRKHCIEPSDKLVSDEGMCAYEGEVGQVKPSQLPVQSFVPRKPKTTGGEIKMLCDGVSGVTLVMEHDVGKGLNPKQKFYEEWKESDQAFTIAQNMRLVEHYFKSKRTYGADSWFIGVSECEAMLQEVWSYFSISTPPPIIPFTFSMQYM